MYTTQNLSRRAFALLLAPFFVLAACTSTSPTGGTTTTPETVSLTVDGKSIITAGTTNDPTVGQYATLYGDGSTTLKINIPAVDNKRQLPASREDGITNDNLTIDFRGLQPAGTYLMQTTRTGSTTGSISITSGYFRNPVSSEIRFTITQHTETRLVGTMEGTFKPNSQSLFANPIVVRCTFDVAVLKK